MKILSTFLALMLSGLSVLSAEEANAKGPAPSETIVIAEVHGMVCAFCAQGIDKTLGKLDSVEGVLINLKQNVVAVSEKEGASISDDEIREIVTDAGFSVTSLTRQPGTLTELEKSLDKRP